LLVSLITERIKLDPVRLTAVRESAAAVDTMRPGELTSVHPPPLGPHHGIRNDVIASDLPLHARLRRP